MHKYALIIEHEACWGCKTCEVACKQEFNTPQGVRFISVVEDGPKMHGGKLDFVFRVNVCQHCEDPPCADACTDEAIFKREDGIVVLEEEACTGCQSCIAACPYDVIDFDAQSGIARKCNLCHNRIDQGLLPACADNVCLAHCIHFGDPAKMKQ
jgi:Fe-S-cluster-containing dehydrogenase component